MIDTPLNLFFSDIKSTKILSKDEEIVLSKTLLQCECFKKDLKNKCPNCSKAINIFVVHNLPLVVKIAQNYQERGLSLDDLIGFGIYGAFKAASKYNYTKKVRFASYAAFWIKDEILKALRTCSGVPKIPPYLITKVWKISKAVASIVQENKEITVENIMTHTGFSQEDIEKLQQLLYQTTSLDAVDLVLDLPSPEHEYIRKERTKLVQRELKRVLSPTQFSIVCHYFGIFEYSRLSLKAIAQQKDLSLEWVRQIKKEAEEILRTNKLLRLLGKEMQ